MYSLTLSSAAPPVLETAALASSSQRSLYLRSAPYAAGT